MNKNYSHIFLSILFLIGCANGNCKQNAGLQIDPKAEKKLEETMSSDSRVKIYKYDGSLQCGMGQSIAPDVMKKELGNIQVFSSESKSDGLMRTQVCGSPTGKANVFEINKKDLDQALAHGFKLWTFN